MQRQKIKHHELAEEDIVDIIRDCNNSASGKRRFPSILVKQDGAYLTPTKKEGLQERPSSAKSDPSPSKFQFPTNASPKRLNMISKLSSPEKKRLYL